MLLSPLLVLSLLVAPEDTLRAPLRPREAVREYVAHHTADVRRCYERYGLRRNADLRGIVELDVTILPTGVVAAVTVMETTLAGPGADEVAACLATIARHWRFERGAYGTEIHTLPFRFAPEPRPARNAAAGV